MGWIIYYSIICILGITAVIKYLKNKQSGGGMVDATRANAEGFLGAPSNVNS